MAKQFTGHNPNELAAFIEKEITLLNVHLYDLPKMRKEVNKKEAQPQNQNSEIRQEEDNKEYNNFYSDFEEESTYENTKEQEQEQKNENENEEEINDFELYDFTLALEMRPIIFPRKMNFTMNFLKWKQTNKTKMIKSGH